MNDHSGTAPSYVPLTFGVEGLYPPMAIPTTQLRELYMKLADPCRFVEFRQFGEGQGGRLAEGNNRHLTVAHDRLVYRDDFTQTTFSSFVEDLELILNGMREAFQMPVLLHSKVLLRMLLPIPGGDNSLEYIQRSLMESAVSQLHQFQRPVSGIGLRIVFPPTSDTRSTFHLRIEPYLRDLKMFFLENDAQFFDPVVNMDGMRQYCQQAYDFLKEQAGPFVLSLPHNS